MNDCFGMKNLNLLRNLHNIKVIEYMLERVNSNPPFVKHITTFDDTKDWHINQSKRFRKAYSNCAETLKRTSNSIKREYTDSLFDYRRLVHSDSYQKMKESIRNIITAIWSVRESRFLETQFMDFCTTIMYHIER